MKRENEDKVWRSGFGDTSGERRLVKPMIDSISYKNLALSWTVWLYKTRQ